MANNISAKKKLATYLLKRDPKLSEKELNSLLGNIKRFVTVVQKIYTEPQAQIKYKDVIENGKKTRKRIIETDIEEVSKVNKGTNKPITVETLREFTQKVTENKYKIHGK